MVSKVDLLVLGLLTDRPMHGYEISQVIAAEEIEAWLSVSLTSIYYSLNKLKKNGMIVETVHRSDNSPERSVFHLTDKGRASFLDLLERSLASSERTFFRSRPGRLLYQPAAEPERRPAPGKAAALRGGPPPGDVRPSRCRQKT